MDILLTPFSSTTPVSSNNKVFVHTDGVWRNHTGGHLARRGGRQGSRGGSREEFWIHLFQTGPRFHPFIQLLKGRSVSEKGWRSLCTAEKVGMNSESQVLRESGQSLRPQGEDPPLPPGCASGGGGGGGVGASSPGGRGT